MTQNLVKEIAKKPQEDAEIFRLLVDAVTDYSIFAMDTKGCIWTWNPGAERLTGYSSHEIIGKHFSTFYPQKLTGNGHPEMELRLALQDGRYEEEGFRVRKNGTEFWANVILTPLRDRTGKHIGFTKVTRDLTERKAAEEKRAADDQRFRLLVEGVKDYAILMLDIGGHVSSWNEGARRFKGWEAHEILGKHFSTFYPEEDVRAKKPEMELEIASRVGRFEDEGWRVRKDGGRFWANVVITALRSPDGKLVGFSKVTRDLTERKRAEEDLRHAYGNLELRIKEKTGQLEEALRSRDEFLSIASHELKTPITGLKMQIQMAKMRLADPKLFDVNKQIKALEVSENQLDRLTQLIEDLLDISRIQAGKLSYNFESVNLKSLIDDLLEGFQQQIASSNAEVKIYIDDTLTGCWDRIRLEQVLINLISNALKYAPRSPIVVFAKLDEGHAVITVQDFGPGISEKDRGKIFERFSRLNNDRNVGGLGLGLYISRQIVRAHGGNLELKRSAEPGATFMLRIPLDSGAASQNLGSLT